VTAEELRDLAKNCINAANASELSLHKDITLEGENYTMAFSDRTCTMNILSDELVTTPLAAAHDTLGLMHMLTPNLEALPCVAEGDHKASTLLMANGTSVYSPAKKSYVTAMRMTPMLKSSCNQIDCQTKREWNPTHE
jgi:hypothetical protein